MKLQLNLNVEEWPRMPVHIIVKNRSLLSANMAVGRHTHLVASLSVP